MFPRQICSILSKMWSLLPNILKILQRPKILMFLSVITIFFMLNRSKTPVMHKARVNFEGIERDVPFEKGDDVMILRYLIMIAFSDVRLDRVPPACVKLLKYDDRVEDHVPLPLDLKLEEDIQVKVRLPSTEEERVSCGMEDPSSTDDPAVPHRIEPRTPYRLWNPASVSLIQRDSNSLYNTISCNGSFKDMDYDTVATTIGVGRKRFAFIFEDNVKSTSYVLNATNKGRRIEAAVFSSRWDIIRTPSMKFEPFYYWSFTMFRNLAYKTLYLGCNDGRALLVPMENTSYPDPRALFITNKYNLRNNYIP